MAAYDIGADGEVIYGYEIGAQRMAAVPGAANPVLRERGMSKAREYVLGFDSVATVAAAATAIITNRPQVVFRPDRIVVPASISPSFLINDFKVGKNSQFAAASAVPAEIFSQNAFGVRLKMDTANPAVDVVINVTNISAGALRFLAAVIGPAVE